MDLGEDPAEVASRLPSGLIMLLVYFEVGGAGLGLLVGGGPVLGGGGLGFVVGGGPVVGGGGLDLVVGVGVRRANEVATMPIAADDLLVTSCCATPSGRRGAGVAGG